MSSRPGVTSVENRVTIERPGFRFYAPIATSLLISLLLTVVLSLIARRTQ